MAITEIRNERIQLKTAERAVWWRLADLEADAVRQSGRQIVSDLAADTGESVRTVQDRLTLAAQYPDREGLEDATPALLRACIQAAARLAATDAAESATLIAQRAVKSGMSAADVAALGTGHVHEPATRCVTCGRPQRA